MASCEAPRSPQIQRPGLSTTINEEFLTCKICYSILERPKILDCLHSFCRQCLVDHVGQNDLIDLLPCPLCRQRTPIPNGVDDLKDNFLLLSLQDAVVRTETLAECDSCKSRDELRTAVKRCVQCAEQLCEDCIQAHQRLTLTKQHQMEPLNAPAADQQEKVQTAPKDGIRCSKHDDECKLYCEACCAAICVTCRLTSHDGHKVTSLEQAAAAEKQELSKWLDFITNRIEKYSQIMESLRAYRTDLDGQRHSTEAQIDHRCQELHTLIDGWHYATSKQMEAACNEENKQLNSKLDQVEVALGTNQGLFQLTDTILRYTSPANFLTLRSQLVQDLSKLQRENLNALCHTQQAVLSFNDSQRSLNFDHMGEFVLSYEKVLTGVQIRPVQSITFVKSFLVREQSSGSRFDASAISASPADDIVVTDRQSDRITTLNVDGQHISQLNTAIMGKPITSIVTGNRDLVFTRDKQSVCVFSSEGQHKLNLKDLLNKPCSLALDQFNLLYVLDYHSKAVTKYSTDTYTRVSQHHLAYNKSSIWDKIAINSLGNLYLCAFAENCVYEFTSTGQKLASYGRWGSTDAGDLYWPRGMCVDVHDNVLVADTNNNRVQMLTPQGAWVLLEPPQGHKISSPSDVAVTSKGLLCVLERCGQVMVYQYLPY